MTVIPAEIWTKDQHHGFSESKKTEIERYRVSGHERDMSKWEKKVINGKMGTGSWRETGGQKGALQKQRREGGLGVYVCVEGELRGCLALYSVN